MRTLFFYIKMNDSFTLSMDKQMQRLYQAAENLKGIKGQSRLARAERVAADGQELGGARHIKAKHSRRAK